MNKAEIIKNRVIKPEDFIWKIFYPSLWVKSSFLKLFTLFYNDFSKFFILKSIVWDRNKFNITLKSIDLETEYNLFFTDNKWISCNWIFCTKNICTWIHDKNVEINLKKFLLNFSIKWKDLTFYSLLSILSNDYKAKRDYYKIFWKSEVPPYSIINDWWAEIHKVRFSLNENIVRDLDHSLEFSIPEIFLHHSERECLWINAINDKPNKLYRFFNYSDEFFDHEFDKYFYLSKEERSRLKLTNKLERLTAFSDLNEEDIIMWNSNTKLQNMMDDVEKIVKEKDLKLVWFNCSCVPRIIWDDMYSILKKAKERLKVPFMFEWSVETSAFESRVEMLDEYINNIDKSTLKIKKNTIALFWYHQDKYTQFLNKILIKNWIKINLIFIPMVDIKLLPSLFESELYVFQENKHYDEIYEYPFKYLCNNNYLSLKSPAWIIETDNWFKEILWRFNIDYKRWNDIEKIVNEYNKKVCKVKENQFKAWFIFTWLDDIERFFTAEYTSNIDIINFLLNMWFKIEFFIFDSFDSNRDNNKFSINNWNHNLITNLILDKIKDKNSYSINFISNEKELYNKISNSNISIIYSDIYFDERVVKMWLNQFNLRHFKLWYEWALESINSLIRLCEMKFYKGFKKYLN